MNQTDFLRNLRGGDDDVCNCDEDLLWGCKYCGETEYPECHHCVREDGKMVEDELMDRWMPDDPEK